MLHGLAWNWIRTLTVRVRRPTNCLRHGMAYTHIYTYTHTHARIHTHTNIYTGGGLGSTLGHARGDFFFVKNVAMGQVCHTTSPLPCKYHFPNAPLTFFRKATSPSGPGSPHYRGFTITLRHTTLGRTPLDGWSARRRDLYLTTHNTHNRQTSHVPGGIRTRNPSKRAAADQRLRLRRLWDRSPVSVLMFILILLLAGRQMKPGNCLSWWWTLCRLLFLYSKRINLWTMLISLDNNNNAVRVSTFFLFNVRK
jgi:hypothetical protein